MAIDDFYTNFVYLLRWLHIIAGIMWIGHLYFFNFVNGPFQGVLAKEIKPQVNPLLMPRALWWFRWGAMMTFIFGLTLFFAKYSWGGLWTDQSTGQVSQRGMWILFGMVLGTIMWFNVWFIIWPAQKRLITWMKAGQAPPEQPVVAKRAALFSKINTYLSGPMLFAMLAPNNYPSLNALTLLVTIAIGLGTIWCLYKIAPKVGHTV